MDNGQHREMPADGAINDGQTSDHLAGAGDLQWREIARAVQEAEAVEAVGAPMGQLLAAPQRMQPRPQMHPRPRLQQRMQPRPRLHPIDDGQLLMGALAAQWAFLEAGSVEAVGAPMGQLLAAPHMGQLLAAPQQMQPLLQMQPRPQMQQPPPPPMLAALQQMQLPPQVGALPQMGAPPQQMAGAPAGGWQYSGGIVLPFQLDGRVAHLDEL